MNRIRRFKNKGMIVGVIFLTLLYFFAIFAPWVATHDPVKMDFKSRAVPPNKKHLFGTDQLGRDIFSRVIYGGRVSLTVGLIAVGISTIIGVIYGSVSGYIGGRVDSIMMRIVDGIRAFPTMFLLLTIVAFLPSNILNIILVLGLTCWTGTARIVRGQFLSLKEEAFIEAARAVGVSTWRIIFRHLLPNCSGQITVTATMGVGGAILTESALSFLGLGVNPPTPSWGNMLFESQSLYTLTRTPWVTIFPGIFIMITVISFQFVGDGLREIFDPRLN
ncbi:MAG: ABC transporter permease [Halanaerobiales bacterium]|nr:ABC transporter permease [Halanaerobiales bacterium]